MFSPAMNTASRPEMMQIDGTKLAMLLKPDNMPIL